MIDKMYWVCAEPLNLAARLSGAHDLGTPEVLQRRLAALLEDTERKGRAHGIPDEDMREARYAIVAFMDEQILRSGWSGRQQWMSQPLQLVFFGENTAGEGFFQHLDALIQQPERAHVMQIYYLCLALGFQGKYAVRGGEAQLEAYINHVSGQLVRSLPASDVLSPRGLRRDRVLSRVRREAPIVWIGVGFLVLAVAIFVVLRLVLAAQTASARSVMEKLAPASSQVAPAQQP